MKKIEQFLHKLISFEKSPRKLALSFCMGNYIAFSPFLFFHTAMIFVFSWLFRLNTAVTFATAYFINNPLSMTAVYTADYAVGYWLFYDLLGINLRVHNPAWVQYISNVCEREIGIALPCFWSFIIGGNILAVITSLVLYPIMVFVFTRMMHRQAINI